MKPLLIGVGKSFSSGLLNVQKVILVFTSALVIIGIATQASFRYFFRIDFFGLEEVIVLLAFWLYFIGASYGSFTKSHITADIIPVYIKNNKIKSIAMLVTSLITIVIAVLYSLWSLDYILWIAERGTTTAVLKIPVILSRSAIFVGFVLMTAYFIYHFVLDLKRLIKEEFKQ